ncbi:DoxX family protein [Corynebacterium bovis]|uniref:DoxX family protein n=1 Tax=Corynebacterium bovis TaxID=36808 RepID=UPI00244B1077|nr:DoxX family protein [Corynebacterium bovis]MDH2455441.1 DoxX family protein [Corynebacterium bovis]
MDRPGVRDAGLLLLRVVTGVIMVAHGWRKLVVDGIDATTRTFEAAGVPQPGMSAWGVSIVEMLGGALVIVGLLTPAAAGVLALDMLAALYLVHLHNGLFVADGGMELVLLLATAFVVLVVFGAGRASLDRALSRFG